MLYVVKGSTETHYVDAEFPNRTLCGRRAETMREEVTPRNKLNPVSCLRCKAATLARIETPEVSA